ncbi:phosphotransferase family protein [Tistrella mobilis]|uniref:phosphotransferase family protein n=1 Tax=Tistrella mobilis TaxID=171437 RepID=UPI0035574422
MTLTTSPSSDIDAQALAAYLAARVDGAGPTVSLTRLGGGQSNPTYFLDTGSRRLVLRKRPAGTLLPSAHAVDREYRVQAALADTGVAVPRMVHFCDDPTVIGTQFYVMERVDGRVLHDNALPDIPVAGRGAYFDALARMLAAIHAVDVVAVGLRDYGRSGGFAARQIARWTKQWQLSATAANPAMDRLIDWLPRNLPEDDSTTLVHGDFRLGNVMFHPTEPRIVAVLDWELSTLGHPLADLAHSCIYTWMMRPEEYGRGLAGLDRAALGLPEMEAFCRTYFEASGRTGPLTRFHLVLALFRNAVIFEGIAARARQGNAASDDAAEVGRLAPALAARAVALIEEATA